MNKEQYRTNLTKALDINSNEFNRELYQIIYKAGMLPRQPWLTSEEQWEVFNEVVKPTVPILITEPLSQDLQEFRKLLDRKLTTYALTCEHRRFGSIEDLAPTISILNPYAMSPSKQLILEERMLVMLEDYQINNLIADVHIASAKSLIDKVDTSINLKFRKINPTVEEEVYEQRLTAFATARTYPLLSALVSI